MYLSNSPSRLLSQAWLTPVPIQTGTGDADDVATLQGFEGLFANVIRVVVGFGAIALFIMLLVGGFNYITSGGDPKRAAAARATITHALIGITIIASAYLILRIVEAITGVQVTVFRIYQP